MSLKLKICSNENKEVLYSFYNVNNHNFKEDSGFDLIFPDNILIKAGETKLIGLGISCQPDFNNGYYLYPRSSIYKTPLRLANSIGLIDSNYRGELKVALDNIKNYDYEIKAGDRLFQLCAYNLLPMQITIVEELDSTERGSGGFGSTNIAHLSL